MSEPKSLKERLAAHGLSENPLEAIADLADRLLTPVESVPVQEVEPAVEVEPDPALHAE